MEPIFKNCYFYIDKHIPLFKSLNYDSALSTLFNLVLLNLIGTIYYITLLIIEYRNENRPFWALVGFQSLLDLFACFFVIKSIIWKYIKLDESTSAMSKALLIKIMSLVMVVVIFFAAFFTQFYPSGVIFDSWLVCYGFLYINHICFIFSCLIFILFGLKCHCIYYEYEDINKITSC